MGSKRDSKQEIVNTGKDLALMDAEDKGTSRRKFTRNALVGSAVLLTLANRSAWGATQVCISTNLYMSYANSQASVSINHKPEIEAYKKHIDDRLGEEYQDGDKTCYDYEEE